MERQRRTSLAWCLAFLVYVPFYMIVFSYLWWVLFFAWSVLKLVCNFLGKCCLELCRHHWGRAHARVDGYWLLCDTWWQEHVPCCLRHCNVVIGYGSIGCSSNCNACFLISFYTKPWLLNAGKSITSITPLSNQWLLAHYDANSACKPIITEKYNKLV